MNREKEFHRKVLGAVFGDDLFVMGILPFVTIHLYCPNPEHNKTSKRFGGSVEPVIVGTVVVRGIMDGYGDRFVGHWNGGCHDENLDSIILEDGQIANDSTKNTYPYRLHTPGKEYTKFLGEMFRNVALYTWDIQYMKLMDIKRQHAADCEGDSSFKLKDFRFNNYHAIEIWQE